MTLCSRLARRDRPGHRIFKDRDHLGAHFHQGVLGLGFFRVIRCVDHGLGLKLGIIHLELRLGRESM